MEQYDYVGEYDEEEELYPAPADMKHWGSMPYWELEECVALLLDLDPSISWEKVKICQEWSAATDLSLDYAKLRTLILRAYEKNEIENPTQPAVFLAWAESRNLEIPEELKQRVGIVKRSRFLMDDEIQELLKKNDEENALLKGKILELESLVWDGFDENKSTYSKELAIAVKAHGAISKSWKKGSSIKQQITLWLESNYPKLMNEEKERIAKICNWQKSGGAPRTPG